MRKLTIFGALGLVLSASPALADTIVQTIPFDSGVVDVGNGLGLPAPGEVSGGVMNYGGVFRQFSPSLGTLTQVTVGFSGAMAYTTNLAAYLAQPACSGVGECEGAFVSLNEGYGFNGPGFPLFTGETNQMFASTQFGYFPATDPDPIDRQLNPASLAGYVGAGTIGIGGGPEGDDSCWYGDNPASSGLNPTWFPLVCTEDLNLATTLTYTYTPVPEPRSIWLLFTGLGMLGFVGWRRHGRLAAA